MKNKQNLALAIVLAIGLVWGMPRAFGQAQVTGAIQGVITDPSGAILSKATVTLRNLATGASQTGTADSRGEIRFSLLPPSTYSLTVAATGFQTVNSEVTVSVGQVTTANFKMALSTSAQTIEVSGAAPPLIQTENANTSTTLQEKQVQDLPIPGSDINYLALLSPGAIMVGGGSFPSVNGLPTTSNLYTVNGMEDIDPWNNNTNGGASNLLLGLNEVQESTEVSNGFNGSYGTLAGSNVNMVTKGGTNNFHGNLVWDWTGRAMESNDFFFNKEGETRPFVNSNQWAGSFGGPILRNKLFFFVNNEGIALVLPTSATPIFVPSQAFQTATLANLTAMGESAGTVGFYKNMFSLYNAAPGASTAAPTPGGGCGLAPEPAGTPSTPFTVPGVTNCTNEYYSAATNTSHEIVTTFRIDYNLSSADHAYFHFLLDRGVQDTGVSPIAPVFDSISHQPEFNGQFSETHTFGSTAVNQFQAAAQNYKAIFGPSDISAVLSAFPTTLSLGDGTMTSLGDAIPTGRDVTRYQFSDDYSHLWGNHSFQAGVYFSRYDATDFQFGSGADGAVGISSLAAFYYGGYVPTSVLPNDTNDTTNYTQSYPLALQQPLAMYRLGVYGQDEWKVTNNLSLTLALRVDHPSNPICVDNCFADTAGFLNIDHGTSIPYNSSITAGLPTGLPAMQALEIQPRAGFSWQPWGANGKTAIRGGWGMFGDNFPLSTITGFATNPPEDPSFTATASSATGLSMFNQLSTYAPTPCPSGTSVNIATCSSNAALVTGFPSGATLAQLQAAAAASGSKFSIPNLTSSDSKIINPMYYKWNLDVQRQLWHNAALDLAYNGNHGVHELIDNTNVNAYDPAGFTGLPTAPVDPRFLTVTDYQSDGLSNYNGMTATLNDRFSGGVLQVNYTWSHALDSGVGTSGTQTIQYPTYSHLGYGPSDFDYRHYGSASYVWNTPFEQWFGGSNAVRQIEKGWEVTGSVIARTGAPIYVYNTNATLTADGYGGRTLSNYSGGVVPGSCQTPDAPCFIKTEFSSATLGFSTTQSRNMFRGPGYWNTNLSLSRHFAVPGWERANLEIAGNAFNLFNHPNFGNPGESLTSSSTFGLITTMVSPSSSPLGSNGADSSVRIIQMHLALTF